MEPLESAPMAMGLGWGRRSQHHDSEDPQQPRMGSSTSANGLGKPRPVTSSTPEGLMELYLQQCLQYHQEQEHQRRQAMMPSDGTDREQATINESNVQFVKSSKPLILQSNGDDNDDGPAVSSASVETPIEPESFAERVEQGRVRAQAILDRFLQQQTLLLGSNASAPPTQHPNFQQSATTCPTTAAAVEGLPVLNFETDPMVRAFVEQRLKGLEHERRRKEAALLRNLNYVARREADRAATLSNEIEAAKLREDLLRRQHDAALHERHRLQREARLLHSSAALGSDERHKVERVKRQALATRHDASAMDSGASVALYLSGMPTDDSIDEKTVRHLFGSYGVIRKVRFYRNKETGMLKGDGLLVFQVNQGDLSQDLVSTVCSQVRHAYRLIAGDGFGLGLCARWFRACVTSHRIVGQ